MSIDRYTKIILTIIAVALTINLSKSLVMSAQADMPIHVIVDQVSSYAFEYVTVPVKIKTY